MRRRRDPGSRRSGRSSPFAGAVFAQALVARSEGSGGQQFALDGHLMGPCARSALGAGRSEHTAAEVGPRRSTWNRTTTDLRSAPRSLLPRSSVGAKSLVPSTSANVTRLVGPRGCSPSIEFGPIPRGIDRPISTAEPRLRLAACGRLLGSDILDSARRTHAGGDPRRSGCSPCGPGSMLGWLRPRVFLARRGSATVLPRRDRPRARLGVYSEGLAGVGVASPVRASLRSLGRSGDFSSVGWVALVCGDAAHAPSPRSRGQRPAGPSRAGLPTNHRHLADCRFGHKVRSRGRAQGRVHLGCMGVASFAGPTRHRTRQRNAVHRRPGQTGTSGAVAMAVDTSRHRYSREACSARRT